MIDLSGKVALVTGASRGIGRATALKLAEAGADIIVNYVTSQSAATEVADEVRALGRKAATIKADVSEPEDVKSMMEFVRNSFERLDILVSNAASGGFRTLMDASPRHFDAAMHTNVRSLISLVQEGLPLLTASQGQAKVITLSSHGSHRALSNYALIGASKAALEAIIRHMALELGPQGINFNVVLAGLVATDAVKNLPGSDGMFEFTKQHGLVPDRELLPSDVANAILFLASPLSDLVQGQTLVVDAGIDIRG